MALVHHDHLVGEPLGLIDEMANDGKTVLMCTHLLLEAEAVSYTHLTLPTNREV